MSKVKIVVTVDRNNTGKVADRLRAAGVTVTNEMDHIGILSALADEHSLLQVENVPGVLNVEPDRAFQIAPPSRAIQ